MRKRIIRLSLLAFVGSFAVSCGNGNQEAAKTGPDLSTVDPSSASAFTPGVYKGTIPRTGGQMEVSLVLNADSSFILKETSLENDGRKGELQMENTGTWKYDAGTQKIYLAYKNLADRMTSFSVSDDKTIQMHDGSMETRQTSGKEYNLRKE